MEGITIFPQDYDLDLPLGYIIKSANVRGGRVWGILTKSSMEARSEHNRILFLADFNIKPQPLVKVFPEIDNCLFLYISSDGSYCGAKRSFEFTCVSIHDLKGHTIPQLPNSDLRAATFTTDSMNPKPVLFMIMSDYQLCYVNLNNLYAEYKINLIQFSLQQENIIQGLSIIKLKDGYYGGALICSNLIVPFIINSELTLATPATTSRDTMGKVNRNIIFTNNDMIGVAVENYETPQKHFILQFIYGDDRESHSRLHKMLPLTRLYNLEQLRPLGISLFDEFTLFYSNGGQVNIFLENETKVIDTFILQNASFFDFDNENGELLGFFQRTITILKFESSKHFKGVDSFRFWLFNRFLEKNDIKNAAAVLNRMSSLSLNEIIALTRSSELLRFHVYLNLLDQFKQQYQQSSQKKQSPTPLQIAIANATFELYTRIEMNKKQAANVNAYCKFTKELINLGFLDMKTVQNTLEEYGWDTPLIRLSSSASQLSILFDKCFEVNEPQRALHVLSLMPENDENYSKSALRVFKGNEQVVSEFISKKTSLDSPMLAPILLHPSSKSFVLDLLKTGRLTNSWISKIYAIVMARESEVNKKSIAQFFRRYQFVKDGSLNFMMRELFSLKRYALLAYGFASISEYVSASQVIARDNDAFNLFSQIIPIGRPNTTDETNIDDIDSSDEVLENETKKHCINAILRSVDSSKAGQLAMNLLDLLKNEVDDKYQDNDIDSTILMLLDFLPYETKISFLSGPLAQFTSNKKAASEEQKKKIDEALDGIKNASKLIHNLEEKNPIEIQSFEICEKCKKPFFSEKGIVYPCNHFLHVSCVKQLLMEIPGIENMVHLNEFDHNSNEKKELLNHIDLHSDCPICGFWSLRRMNEPYTGNICKSTLKGARKNMDPFPTDLNQLTQFSNMGKKNLFNLPI